LETDRPAFHVRLPDTGIAAADVEAFVILAKDRNRFLRVRHASHRAFGGWISRPKARYRK
jgi:hypothetical protein